MFTSSLTTETSSNPVLSLSHRIHRYLIPHCLCRISEFVYKLQDTTDSVVGKVVRILAPQKLADSATIILLERFSIGGQHADLGMPTIHRYPEQGSVLVGPKNIMFKINVQHDCARAACDVEEGRAQMQEREATEQATLTIKHNDDDHFVVNMHSLHNAHLIRKVFPQEILAPSSRAQEDTGFHLHRRLATNLRAEDSVKKAQAAEKRKATNARKAMEKEAMAAQASH